MIYELLSMIHKQPPISVDSYAQQSYFVGVY